MADVEAAGDVEMEDADRAQGEAAAPGARAGSRARIKLLPDWVEELYPNLHRIRGQHRRNLLALLTNSLLDADYCTAAGAAGTLLAALPPGAEQLGLATRGGDELVRLVHVLWAALEVLLQHGAPQDQVKRLLRRSAVVIAQTPSLRQTAQLELILHSWKHSGSGAALELIAHEEGKGYVTCAGSNSSFAVHLSWITALIKHRAWFQQALALQASTSSQLSTSTNLLGPLQLPLAPLQAFVNQAGSQLDSGAAAAGDLSQSLGGADDVPGVVRDAAAELETSLTRVLGVAPGASHPVLLMCHLLVVTGRQSEAVAVAAAAAAASGMTPELLSLWALLTEPQELQAVAAAAAAAARQPRAGFVQGMDAMNGVHGLDHEHEHSSDSGDSGHDMEDVQPDLEQQEEGVTVTRSDDADADADVAGAGVGAGVSAAAAAESAAAVHSYVTVCEQVLTVDPWALGAVEGLVQVCSHCHNCTAAAVRGLLCHLDAALPEAAAAVATASSAGPVEQWWPVLAGLLLQLAVAAAGAGAASPSRTGRSGVGRPSSATAAGAAATVAAATAAAGGGSSGVQEQQQEAEGDSAAADPGAIEAAAGAGAGAGGGGGGGGVSPPGGTTCPWELWQQLQLRCFAPRQHWWPDAFCNTKEITAMGKELQLQLPSRQAHNPHLVQQQQQTHSHQRQTQQRGAGQGSQRDISPAQRLVLPGQHMSLANGSAGPCSGVPGGGDAAGLLGSAAGGGGGLSAGGPSSGQRLPLSQYHLPMTQQNSGRLLDLDNSQGDGGRDAREGQQAAGRVGEGRVSGWQQQEQQEQCLVDAVMVMCSKAMVFGFVLGPGNAYSAAAAAAFAAAANMQSAAAAAAPAAIAGGGGGSAAAAPEGCVSEGGTSLLQVIIEARVALQDALNLAAQLQQVQVQLELQQQQQQPKRHFGAPTAEFGALLDMPDAWWAAFPHRRRMARRQQEQQHQGQGGLPLQQQQQQQPA